MAQSASAARAASAPTFQKAPEAFARLTEEETREAEAYTLGVQTVIWGTQWVKAAESMRMFSAPLPEGRVPSPYDPLAHAVNVWGHAQKLLNADTRLIETPNTETLYSVLVIDLKAPVVVVHPDFGDRYFRTSIWDIHGDTHTISQKQDGGAPPPYVLTPVDWQGEIPKSMKSYEIRSRYVQLAPHIAVYGEDDLPNVHAMQKGIKAIAVEHWGKSNAELAPAPPIPSLRRSGTKTPPELMFFEELGEALRLITVRDDELGFRAAGREHRCDTEGRLSVRETRRASHLGPQARPARRKRFSPVTTRWERSSTAGKSRAILAAMARATPIRYSLSSRDPMQYHPDGSLTIYVQKSDPGGEATANWLPRPTARSCSRCAFIHRRKPSPTTRGRRLRCGASTSPA